MFGIEVESVSTALAARSRAVVVLVIDPVRLVCSIRPRRVARFG